MGLLSKPSRKLLLEVLGKVMNEGKCTCKTAFVHCAHCDVVDVLQMEARGLTLIVECVEIDGPKLKLPSGKEVWI